MAETEERSEGLKPEKMAETEVRSEGLTLEKMRDREPRSLLKGAQASPSMMLGLRGSGLWLLDGSLQPRTLSALGGPPPARREGGIKTDGSPT